MLLTETPPREEIVTKLRSVRQDACPLCERPGQLIHVGMEDETSRAVPGAWSMRECENPVCGLCWLSPPPRESDLQALYRDYHTHSSTHHEDVPATPPGRLYHRARRGFWANRYGYPPERPAWLSRLLGHLVACFPLRAAALSGSICYLRASPGGSLLDVGCGCGDQLVRLRALGWSVAGTEADAEAAQLARHRGLTVYAATFNGATTVPGTYDAVTLNQVIEHVPHPDALIRACADMLKPGGQLVITTPNAHAWGRRLFGMHWRGWEVPRHLRVYTTSALYTLVTRAGIRVDECRTVVGSAYTHRWSLALRRDGAPRNRLRTSDRLAGGCLALFHLVRLHLRPDCGEYIVLHAHKPPTETGGA